MSGAGPVRAPQQDGAILAVPPLEAAGERLDANRQRLRAPGRTLAGRSWQEVRQLARLELLETARRYLASHGEPLAETPASTIVLAGHQPELFHPGVWLKNFAIAGLARRHGGTAINLLIDTDTVASTALRLPMPATEPTGWPTLRTLAFDHWQGELPWEERGVLDQEQFARFGETITQTMRPWGFAPLIGQLWPEVCRQAGKGLIGEAFSAARRGLERSWGCHNLEVPLSLVCQGEGFAWFAAALLLELPRFVQHYNDSVRGHRAREGIRSRNHPVPDLAIEGDWFEAPFWAWRAGQGRRGRLFIRSCGARLEMRCGTDSWPEMPIHPTELTRAWCELPRHGFKVRSRALTTTLFARLFLADLFVHGIGGGKYDELTNVLMQRFFDVPPPAFLILSGTRRLPIPAYPATVDDRRALIRRLRDLRYNPQRHLRPQDAERLHDALEERQAWLAGLVDQPAQRRERFHALRAVNTRLAEPLAAACERTRQELLDVEQQLAANAILQRRDYSFCLYPESTLRPFCTRLL